MSYVVKKVRKGRKTYYYVYWQKRVGKKVINKSIGSLNKIVEAYLTATKIKNWRRGRDSNPGGLIGQRVSNPPP